MITHAGPGPGPGQPGPGRASRAAAAAARLPPCQRETAPSESLRLMTDRASQTLLPGPGGLGPPAGPGNYDYAP